MLNIIYRLCENEADGRLRNIRPPWFSKQKCLKSFLDSVEFAKNMINKVVFVHDGDGDILLNLIPKEFEIIKINYKSNLSSLYETLDVADRLGDDLYFVEDDYLHFTDSISKINAALPKYKLLTGYDHLRRYVDCDDMDYEKLIDFNFASNHHWRTAESTCCTYAIEKNLYKKHRQNIRDFALNDRGLFRYFHSVNTPLWTAIPGLTTQVDPYMSPGINWEKLQS
jgi:hypothetical protein